MTRLVLDEAWLNVDFVAALRANLAAIDAGDLEAAARCAERSPPKAARMLASWIYDDVDYGFEGDAHRIVSWAECRARGFAACADAAALAGACLIRAHHVGLFLCYETLPNEPDYAHVRVHVAETLVEPWPHARRPVDSCTRRIALPSLLGSPR